MPPSYDTAYSHFPPLASAAWLVPLYLQALLLHPRFPSGPSRVLRLLLAFPAVYLAWHAPERGFEPRDITRGLNAAFSFVSMYGAWKAIEWGTAADRRPYEWVGWGEESKGKGKEGSGESSDDDKGADKLVTVDTSQDSWTRIAISGLHLLSSMRMIGYRAWSGRPPKPITTTTFLLRTTARLIGTHLGTLATIGFLTLPDPKRHSLLVSAVPALASHPVALDWASEAVGYCCFGLAAWQGLACTHAVLSLAFFALNHAGRTIGLPLDRFDAREFIPLFRAPYYPTSVRRFWSTQWHQLLRRVFFSLGTSPPYRLTLFLTNSDALGKLAAVFACAGMTAFVHEYAIRRATAGLELTGPRDSFVEKHGGSLFLFLMGVMALVEQAFTRLTGRRVRGVWGWLATSTLLGAAPASLLYWSWRRLAFIQGMPEPETWGWQRLFVPLLCVAPEPLWMK